MYKGWPCELATIFFIAHIFMFIGCSASINRIEKDFLDVITDEQKIIYERIISNRYQSYILGGILGSGLAIALGNFTTRCTQTCIIVLVQYLYYRYSAITQFTERMSDNIHYGTKSDLLWKQLKAKYKDKYMRGLTLGLISVFFGLFDY